MQPQLGIRKRFIRNLSNHAPLAASALRLLIQHFSQRKEMVNGFKQVCLSVCPSFCCLFIFFCLRYPSLIGWICIICTSNLFLLLIVLYSAVDIEERICFWTFLPLPALPWLSPHMPLIALIVTLTLTLTPHMPLTALTVHEFSM